MKLRATIVAEWEVKNLDDYEASNIQEAADMMQAAYDDIDNVDFGIEDIIDWADIVSCQITVAEDDE